MRRSLPSLSALRAFDAAGRLLSFSRAAQELHVTQSAVSRQIRALEETLKADLFVRLTRKVELTEAGESYLRSLQGAFDDIERATDRFQSQRESRVLRIGILPSVASSWLMPRLAGFTQQYPEIETRIITSIEPVDFNAGEVDVAVRVGALPGKRYGPAHPRIDLQMVKDWRGVRADMLFEDVLVPVCASRLAQGLRQARPRDLQGMPLVHTTSRRNAWPDWFRAHGLTEARTRDDAHYGHFFMSLEAARQGRGLAIVPSVLMEGNRYSDLVRLFPPDKPSAGEYYLLARDSDYERREIALFRAWLQAQVSEAAAGNAEDTGMAVPMHAQAAAQAAAWTAM